MVFASMAVLTAIQGTFCGLRSDVRIIIRVSLQVISWTACSGSASVIRGDMGTENTRIASIQRFLRREAGDSWSGEKSFLYGRSLRRGGADWWIRHFKDLRDSGLYCDTNVVHVECLLFCYMALIHDELQKVARLWNLHRIRPSILK